MDNKDKILVTINSFHRERMANKSDINILEKFQDQGYDSLDFVEMVIYVEQEVNVNIPDVKIENYNLHTPQEFVEMVNKILNQK
jgi:acyl carrier protein